MKQFIKDRKLFIRRLFLILLDAILINMASFLGLIIRFDFRISQVPTNYAEAVLSYTLINTLVTIIIFALFRLYNSLWKYAGIDELTNILFACVSAGAIQLILMHFVFRIHVPRSFYPSSTLFLIFFISMGRFFYRYIRRLSRRNFGAVKERIMIIGAGEAGSSIIREISGSVYVNGSVICAIDDNKDKMGSYIQGIKVVGDRNNVLEAVEKYEITSIIVAMPSASKRAIREILEICKQTNCRLKLLPGMYQLINEEVSVTELRDVEIDDLLGREPVKIDLEEVMNYVSGKVVLVTGGGGSIGSELCRQLAGHKPKQLIILDIYENNAYSIEQELKSTHPDLNLTVLIASVRNTKRIHKIMERYHPDIIYHAAAHKHVPLMENSPNEAIKNNVGGTYKMAMAAHLFGVKKFILISSDKAVNPTNVMGASKRICELIIQAFHKKSKTEFVAVRFGNVLGSNGSVIPLFKEQIQRGGPVTVTHPDIIRYFMTIPEAVSLVLQAGAYAKGGEIFILDMGEPIKIADLAKNLIRLSGYEPDRDIEIEYTGLRPGEKLFEELLMEEEGLSSTSNKLIFIGKQIDIDEEEFLEKVLELDKAAKEEVDDIRERIMELVPTYHPDNAGAMQYVAASKENT
ncbi:NDP-sugar epimerase, includes UDP-GlcNAc-inverting 4,6-dehydratase FlaA1 and capsular polysaccharide biosynthesis protein EpsC [Anaerocolumna jejuensis DSM 15929]|uniref:NDP-sugar epimerase, includes UDP-GlcNAc-inverting 4,6-dehydratase FlaA1 and capsular polysaccharide biosynthesis protein EpsC n=1 Tax=Anaerocolumna jejuensis DSM 15929 TaxID=1121322 RepID=A0A1M6UD15_9FIRM|nr:nucleoside-diphosphate sugar epimerase/dehydratase [Anaerocolumna jejuensis]SHK67063.1 NDP-sugar epimerase, includes UDP-GlcNAc-inverting 4,6-dehydratase FlaA1 and capsular polysaccharide biosynthesis protein EpsC [Anaerocolumna jejuensis DSM 15929]